MARCIGLHPAYGCGHFKEHQAAARKGWMTRRASATFRGTEDHTALGALFGRPVEAAHEHPEHRGLVRFLHKRKWYELPRAEFRRLVGEGKVLQREQARDARRAERAAAHEATYRAKQEKQLAAVERAEYQSVVKAIRAHGGIRPNRADARGKIPELEEWRDLPRAVKTRGGARPGA